MTRGVNPEGARSRPAAASNLLHRRPRLRILLLRRLRRRLGSRLRRLGRLQPRLKSEAFDARRHRELHDLAGRGGAGWGGVSKWHVNGMTSSLSPP